MTTTSRTGGCRKCQEANLAAGPPASQTTPVGEERQVYLDPTGAGRRTVVNDRLASLLDFGAELHAHHDYPATPVKFAQATGIRLIAGTEESANAGPPAIITYNAARGSHRRRFSLWHEMAHVLMGWHGIDADFDVWPDEMEGQVAREQAANLLAGLLMVPRPAMREALDLYGPSPAAILHLQDRTGMSEGVCLRRFTLDDLEASRAAAVFLGSHVADVSAHNYPLPFWRGARVPEPALLRGRPALHLIRKTRVLAVWEG